jgi:quercetin dioxygenase-like cupin family protein
MTTEQTIRRLPDGCIDYDYYRAQAAAERRRARADAMLRLVALCAGVLTRRPGGRLAMRHMAIATLAIGIGALAATFAFGQHSEAHRVVMPGELKWADVPSLPPGAKIAVIEGPMNEEVPFTIRLKLPKGYAIPPHSHPAIERVTVISGTFHMGVGNKLDRQKTHALPAGAIGIIQPGAAHYAWTEEETVVQLNGNGPWGVNYVDPTDDPRNADR